MSTQQLVTTAADMVAPAKGILAADESITTMSKRLEKAGVPATPETRQAYRSMIVTTPGLEEFISGVILSDETFRQQTDDGEPIPQAAARAGILPGIKVDTGAKPLAFAQGETVTEGLDGLRDRLAEHGRMGARFAKWRAVIHIDRELPSDYSLAANASALGRYAALCQEVGIVPIVEPEVLMEGDHPIERCEEVTGRTLRRVFDELAGQRVLLDGIVLKPNMVSSGKSCSAQAPVEAVASATVRCLMRWVPATVPGIAFLSGGQSPRRATEHLQAINSLGPRPWQLTFSYGRALLDPALAAWKGERFNIEAGQQALRHRARCNAAARDGRYDPSMEQS